MQWTRPRNDGGSPIQGYVVEKRKVAQNWSRACHATVSDMTLKVRKVASVLNVETKRESPLRNFGQFIPRGVIGELRRDSPLN